MKKRILNLFLAVVSGVFFASCASTYNPITAERVNYPNPLIKDSVEFSYQYDLLLARGNSKYVKHERKGGIKLVTVKLTNNSSKPFVLNRDATIYSGNKIYRVIEAKYMYDKLKQKPAGYLFYLLLTPLQLNRVSANGTVTSTPIGLPLGPGLTLINFAAAVSANDKLKKELTRDYLKDRVILPGETVFGFVGLRSILNDPLELR